MREHRPCNRGYLFNIINTVKPQFFPANIQSIMKKRREVHDWKKNQYIELTPEMHELLKNSFNIPLSSKGRCLSMLKSGPSKKRKRPSSKSKLALDLRLDKAAAVRTL
mmetsp:Transcript_29151/g.21695  ORF Transcript_29151/g.21695 Transcript_29151/m.21695 type:complete len:108 (+) Transcript_29151:610-933(+)